MADFANLWWTVKDPSKITPEAWGAAAGNVGSLLASAGNNAYSAAVWWSMNDVVSPSTGFALGLVPHGAEINPAVVLAKAVGLSHNALLKYYDLKRELGSMSKAETTAAQLIAQRFHRATKGGEWVDDKSYALVNTEMALLLKPWADNPFKQQQIIEAAFTKWLDPSTPYDALVQEFMNQRMETASMDIPEVSDALTYKTLEKRD
jgi:hypothetical protein